MQDIVITGMGFGDEGKGSFTHYFACKENITNFIKYNGGCQASHTVTFDDGRVFKFSQLSSGMQPEIGRTFLSKHFVIDILNLVVEIKEFAKLFKSDAKQISSRIFIENDCVVVTPYHKVLNKIKEIAKGNDSIGSVGTGVSETMRILDETGICLRARDMVNKDVVLQVFAQLRELVQKHRVENPIKLSGELNKETEFLLKEKSPELLFDYYQKHLNNYKLNFIDDFKTVTKNERVLYEGSQGVLLDKDHGFKPNVTHLTTTNEKVLAPNQRKIGIIKSINSRHGKGYFPTEDKEVSNIISDENQEIGQFNGKIRFGWFDAALLNYAIEKCPIDELALSSLDLIDKFDKIKICTKHEQGRPVYIEMKPNRQEFMSTIERLCNIKIKTFSTGPKFADKVEVLK